MSEKQGNIMNMQSRPFRRAVLVVRCASDILGVPAVPEMAELKLPLNVQEFSDELARRFGLSYPDLVYRTESSIERARLVRDPTWGLPKVVLRQGAPPRQGAAQGA